MDPVVFFAVLIAALLHAGWNAAVKYAENAHLGMLAVVAGHVPFALVSLGFAPLPAPQAWPFIVASGFLHLGYMVFLLNSYRIGDLTHVYPIARGSAPLIVAVVSVAGLGVALSGLEWLAVLLIGVGIMSLVLTRRADGLRNPRAALLALVTGCFIAAYTLNDGLGARAAGTALGFFAWAALFGAALFAGYITLARPGLLRAVPFKAPRLIILGGGGSFIAYVLVVWGFTQAPIALVAALRETSIVFALLLGVAFLRERLDFAKLLSTGITLAGAVLMRLSS